MIKTTEEISYSFLQNVDLICFSHLRWGFVYQRPQHLLSRFAKQTRVYYIEEPVYHNEPDKMVITEESKNLFVVVPHLKEGDSSDLYFRLKQLISSMVTSSGISRYFFWYYTPMALPFTDHLKPEFIVYDCMDELSAFKFAPAELKSLEQQLLKKADVVFTGGYSIYEAKKNTHPNIHPFPSSIDQQHFGQARQITNDTSDQSGIPHPRIGFIGVIDERLDIELIAKAAQAKPLYQFIIIGPVVKIDPAALPRFSNIHYLGPKNYQDLPGYIAGWDIAMIPFAINESTRFISPTKTPEYLAAGKPVISTPIKDVVNPYGDNNLVHIAATAEEFIIHAESELKETNRETWLKKVDAFLAGNSWDRTWNQMVHQLEQIVRKETTNNPEKMKEQAYV